MYTIVTKHGTFNVEDNGKNGAIISLGNIKIAEFPKVSWWNLDGLNAAVEKQHKIIEKRIKECVER